MKIHRKRKIQWLSVLLVLTLLFSFSGITAIPASAAEDLYGAVTTPSVANDASEIGASPFGLTLTYYDTIYSRGFSWITLGEQTDSKVYVVESNLGASANFSAVTPTTATATSCTGGFYSYKAFVCGLSASTTYSYKVGNESHWVFGTFKTESANPTTITAIQLSDAQTLDSTKLNVWENTMAQAVETAGAGLDMILYNGDQADANASTPTDYYARFGIARETVSKYVNSLPYMASSGNHEPANSKNYVLYNTNSIDYGVDGNTADGYTTSGGYYSYDYGFAHFVVLDSNDTSSTQTDWLIADLAAAQSSKWIIAMMHNGPFVTGDHSNNAASQAIVTRFTPIFSAYHVDLVLQAHDHTYNKTLPYKWNAAGYTETYNNSSVVNLSPVTTKYNGKEYDVNPGGTYYVTTGSAGHRVGASEAKDGIWADVNDSTGDNIYDYGYRTNKYKIEVGKITQKNTYTAYTYNTATSDQIFNVGDYATGNVNAQMFGILNLTEDTLTYDFYTVNGNDVKLFDTLNVMKASVTEAAVLTEKEGTENASSIKTLLTNVLNDIANIADYVIEQLRALVDSISSVLEGERESAIDAATSGNAAKVQLQSVQASAAENDKCNIRLIAGTTDEKASIPTVGFKIYKWNGSAYGSENTIECKEVYTSKVSADAEKGFDNEKTVAAMDGGNLFALSIDGIDAVGTVKLKVVPYGITFESAEINGKAFVIEIQDGFIKSVTAE